MVFAVAMLVVSLGLILLAAYVFTNGIESLGHRMRLNQGAVGSILAAVGTALPETIIPIIAIVFVRNPDSHAVGIGAILGAPFMLGTLAFFVTGAAVLCYTLLGRRSAAMHMNRETISRDLIFFILLYSLAVLSSYLHAGMPVRILVAVVLTGGYAWYVHRTLTGEAAAMEHMAPLLLSRVLPVRSGLPSILTQVLLSLGVMVVGAHLFVQYVSAVSVAMGVSALVLSIIITPIATELPEKFNSVIWVGQKKDLLAMGNITGAMVFQSSIPVVFGILLTPWDLGNIEKISAALAVASAILLLIWVRMRRTVNPWALMAGGALYGVFILYVCLRPDGAAQ